MWAIGNMSGRLTLASGKSACLVFEPICLSSGFARSVVKGSGVLVPSRVSLLGCQIGGDR